MVADSRILVAGRLRKAPYTDEVMRQDLGAYALVLLLEGSGYFRVAGGEPVPVRKGQVLTLFPDVPHSYGPLAEEWREAFIVFDGPLFSALEGSVLNRGCSLGVVDRAWMSSFGQQVDDWLARPQAYQERACARLHASLVALMEASSHAPGFEMMKAAKLLEQGAPLTSVARRCGLGYERFRKRFREAYGVAPAQYRLRHLLAQAKAMLLEEEGLTVAEVASRLGFCDQYYFSRAFRKAEGIPPAQFRRSFR